MVFSKDFEIHRQVDIGVYNTCSKKECFVLKLLGLFGRKITVGNNTYDRIRTWPFR